MPQPPDHGRRAPAAADFAEVYTRAKERGTLVTVFTNATLVDEDIVRLFEDLPPQEVEVSLYGASEDVYERVTGAGDPTGAACRPSIGSSSAACRWASSPSS